MAECEICGADAALVDVTVAPKTEVAHLCETCAGGIKGEAVPEGHWQALTTSMWSENDAVKVLSWRLLNRYKSEAWASDALEMLYLEPEVEDWAKAAGPEVVLIKDLPVKGGGFTAKRGTAVRGISLVQDNAGHIEGRVEGQRIVILTEFVKKR